MRRPSYKLTLQDEIASQRSGAQNEWVVPVETAIEGVWLYWYVETPSLLSYVYSCRVTSWIAGVTASFGYGR